MLLSELLLTFKTTESTKYQCKHPPLHLTKTRTSVSLRALCFPSSCQAIQCTHLFVERTVTTDSYFWLVVRKWTAIWQLCFFFNYHHNSMNQFKNTTVDRKEETMGKVVLTMHGIAFCNHSKINANNTYNNWFTPLWSMVFLCALTKLQKATVSFTMSISVSFSIHPSVHMEKLGSNWVDFHEILYLRIFQKSVRGFKFH